MNQNLMKNKNKILVMTAMFAAIIAVMSQIAIPMPIGVPITLQTFAVALTGVVLGWKYGAISTMVYVLLGAVGVPVFSGFSGGPSVIVGMTGGFIYGFIIMAVLCGIGAQKKNIVLSRCIGLAGLLCCHMAGVIQFAVITERTFWEAALLVSIPYIIKDIVSVLLAYMLGNRVKRIMIASQE